MEVAVSPAVTSQLVSNTGTLQADGGTIQLTAAAGAQIVNSLIVNTGTLQTQSVGVQNGEIVIAAAGSQVGRGHQNRTGTSSVQIAGKLDATGKNPGEAGGKVRILADNVTVQPGAIIDASGNASGGSIRLKAGQISQQGALLAQSAQGNGGQITISFNTLYADAAESMISVASASSTGGDIRIDGDDNASLIASGAYISDGNTTGGGIDLLTNNEVLLLGAYLSSRGPLGGGTIRIGGDYIGTTGTRRAEYTCVDSNTLILADATNDGDGGAITVSGTTIAFAGLASAEGGPNGGKGGTITLFAPGSNAVAGNSQADKTGQATSTVLMTGTLEAGGYAAGATGGSVSVLGDNVGLLSGTLIDVSGDDGGGYVRIGGDFHGAGTTPTALNTYVDTNAIIMANANTSGNGGKVAVWSDGNTWFYGNILAEGGKNSGNGGFVETSGHGYLNAEGYVDLTAVNGGKGTYLLDPATIEIYGNVTPAFNATDASISLSANLKLWLDASDTANVNLTYNSLGTTATGTSGTNTITVSANTSLVVGARIRLGGAGSVTAASTLGADTYTITNIAGTTITLSSNLTNNYAGSAVYQGYVSQLTDKSGQTNNATQATAANMPLWISNGMNGLGTVSYNGSSNYLQFGTQLSYADTSGFSIMLIYQGTDNGTGTGGLGMTLLGRDSGDIYANLVLNGGKFEYLHYNGGWLTNVRSTTAVSDNQAYNLTYVNNNQAGSIFVNSNAEATNQSSVISNPAFPFRINNLMEGYSGKYTAGTLPEAVIYNTNLSTNARNLVEQYQSAKWGIALTPPGTGATEVAKATASDGYSVFTTRYLERLSSTADIALSATGNITLDLQGDTLALTTGRNLSLTTTSAGNISNISSGTITTTQSGGSGGNITMTTAGSGTINLDSTFTLNAGGALSLTTAGGALTLGHALTLGNGAFTVNSGTGTFTASSTIAAGGNAVSITADSVSLGGNVSGTGSFTIRPYTAATNLHINDGTSSGLYLTSTEQGYFQSGFSGITIGSSSGTGTLTVGTSSWSSPLTLLNGSGAITFAGSQTLGSNENFSATTTSGSINTSNSGTLTTAGTATITMNSGGDLNLSNFGLTTANSAVSLTATNTAYLNAINSGTGSLTVNATDVYLYGGGLPNPGNLVGYWRFDEGSGTSATDSSGNGNTGTLTNGPTYSSSVPGGLTNDPYSLSFDGINDWVSVPSSSALQIPGNATISVWVNLAAAGSRDFVEKGSSWQGNIQYGFGMTGGKLAFLHAGQYVAISNYSVPTGSWVHLLAVRDTTAGTITYYANGVSQGAFSYGTNPAASTSSALGIGDEGGTTHPSTLQTSGLIDDVHIYNAALSATAISDLYSGTGAWQVGTTSITASHNINLDLTGETLNLSAGKNMALSAANAFNSTSAGTLGGASANGSITLTANSLSLTTVPTIQTTGVVTIKPYTASTTVGVAGGAGTLGVTSALLNAISGASEVDIGATTDTGLLTSNAYTWAEAGKLYAGSGGIAINGVQTMGTNSFFAQTASTGDITIGASGGVSSTAAGTPITLVSNHNFINNAGSGALSAASGRWLVYSTNPANDTIGSLSNSFRRFSCTYGGSCPSFPGTGNGLLYSYTPTLLPCV